MICVDHIRQQFGRVMALRDVSFTIDRGEMVGLIGPSGAGKTTLLRVLSTYMAPTSGTVTINGVHLTEDSLRIRRMLGYMPEKDPIYPEMRVLEYLSFRAQLRGLSGRTRVKRLRELIGRCGLAGLERALMGKLSKGELRRVLLADCLAGDPELVLLDEPTLGLDPVNSQRIKTSFAQMKGERTVVFSTHDMAEAESLCTRVMVLHQGQVSAFAPPADLIRGHGVANLGEVIKAVMAGVTV
jgi:ABC-2 type transport system ATP-binding protein